MRRGVLWVAGKCFAQHLVLICGCCPPPARLAGNRFASLSVMLFLVGYQLSVCEFREPRTWLATVVRGENRLLTHHCALWPTCADDSARVTQALAAGRAIGAWTCCWGLVTVLVDDPTVLWPLLAVYVRQQSFNASQRAHQHSCCHAGTLAGLCCWGTRSCKCGGSGDTWPSKCVSRWLQWRHS